MHTWSHMKAHSQELISRLGQRLLQSFQQLRWLGRATLWQHLVFLGWTRRNWPKRDESRQMTDKLLPFTMQSSEPLLGHPYTTRVIKVDKHTKERTRGLAQLSVLVLPIEMPLHLSSPTWVLSKVWAKCQAPEGQERKEAQLHQCNEDISSNTHTQNDVLTWHETIWRRLYEIMSVSAWHHKHTLLHSCMLVFNQRIIAPPLRRPTLSPNGINHSLIQQPKFSFFSKFPKLYIKVYL